MQEGCWWVSDLQIFLKAISFDIPFSSANAHLLYIYLFGSKPYISLSKNIDPLTVERKIWHTRNPCCPSPSIFHLYTIFSSYVCKSSVFSRTHIPAPYLFAYIKIDRMDAGCLWVPVWYLNFSCTSTVASQMFPMTIITANHDSRRCQETFFLHGQYWQDWAWWRYTCLARGKKLHFIPFLRKRFASPFLAQGMQMQS